MVQPRHHLTARSSRLVRAHRASGASVTVVGGWQVDDHVLRHAVTTADTRVWLTALPSTGQSREWSHAPAIAALRSALACGTPTGVGTTEFL
jgi:hypothetical protein